MAKSMRTYVQMGLLSLLLVVAPAVSYIYLKRGYEYRVESLSELNDYGNLRELGGYAKVDRRTVDVVYQAPAVPADSVAVAIQQLYAAFDQQPDVRFTNIGAASAITPAGARQTDQSVEDRQKLQHAFAQTGQRDKNCERVPIAQRALVVDTLGMVRRCYDLHRGQEVNRIVEQLNILVPRAKSEDIFVSKPQVF